MSSTASSPGRTTPVRRSLVFAAPALAALAYPFLLERFNAAVTASGGGIDAVAAACLVLALLVPAAGVLVALDLGAIDRPTRGELLAKRIALLASAAPPAFTFLGVLLYMAGSPVPDALPWSVFWVLTTLAGVCGAVVGDVPVPPAVTAPSPRLRVAHGVSAAAIVLLFLALHLSNHLSALWSLAAQKALMADFRVVYRAAFIEPLLVGLFLFQVVSGATMLWAYARGAADTFRTLQLCTGAYLIFFVVGHMNSVFFFARTYLGIQTDWNFATGAPTGLIRDAWNIRLLPHYLLGVASVLVHLILGARVVALAHGFEAGRLDRKTMAAIAAAVLLATAIIVGMTGVHLADQVP